MQVGTSTKTDTSKSTCGVGFGAGNLKGDAFTKSPEVKKTSGPASETAAIEKNLVDRNQLMKQGLTTAFAGNAATKFKYSGIQGVRNNPNVTAEFISGVEGVAARIGARPEHLMAVMSFESGGTFSAAKTNSIGATGLIQFLPSTARGLGTTTADLAKMTSTEQLRYVEKYFDQPHLRGKLGTMEGLYTAVLSGSAKQDPNDVLFTAGTKAYAQNPLDWNRDGKITAGEAVTPVAARMYGGVSAVQQKLVDSGFVPDSQKAGFADGSWGRNTAAAVSRFQAANNLPQTGLMDDQTGRALFGMANPTTPPTPSASGILQRGSTGAAVDQLQTKLVNLGLMTPAQKATGAGTFGPRTESAIKAFQTRNKLEPTGTLTPETEKAISDIEASLGRTTTARNEAVTKGIQDRLVELGFMTREQVNTGYGTFGRRTEAAVKAFQERNGIEQTGRVGNLTYRSLFGGSASGGATAPGYSTAENGRNYTVNPNILMTDSLRPQLQTLADRYHQQTGGTLHVTSGYRPPARQASAMYDLIQNHGTGYVRNLYANKGAVDQILAAYQGNRGSRDEAVAAMARAIEGQTARGTYISDHLRSQALDVRPNADFNALRDIVRDMGGSILNEGNHFHIEL